jgi:hypothetical protein
VVNIALCRTSVSVPVHLKTGTGPVSESETFCFLNTGQTAERKKYQVSSKEIFGIDIFDLRNVMGRVR